MGEYKCCNNCVNAMKFARPKEEYITPRIEMLLKEKRVCGETNKEYFGKDKRNCTKFFPVFACTICIHKENCNKEKDYIVLSPMHGYCLNFKKKRNSVPNVVIEEVYESKIEREGEK